MQVFRISGLVLAGIAGSAAGAWAQAPSAVVEEVESSSADVEFMDYLVPGKVIRLGTGEVLVLGYMRSCWRENITGGVVTVGTDQSNVETGTVKRTKVLCNGGAMQLAPEQADKSGALSFRQAPKSTRTVHGISPIIEVKGAGRLTIERTDRRGERHDVDVTADKLLRGAFFDLAQVGVKLAAGGTYRARFGNRQETFKVAPDAQADGVAVIARLVRLGQ